MESKKIAVCSRKGQPCLAFRRMKAYKTPRSANDTLPHAKTTRTRFTEVECHSLELANISAHAILHNIFYKSLWNRLVRHCGCVRVLLVDPNTGSACYRPFRGNLHLEFISGIDDTTVNKGKM